MNASAFSPNTLPMPALIVGILNGLHVSCIQPQEAEDPVRPKDKRQEVKGEWGERAKQ